MYKAKWTVLMVIDCFMVLATARHIHDGHPSVLFCEAPDYHGVAEARILIKWCMPGSSSPRVQNLGEERGPPPPLPPPRYAFELPCGKAPPLFVC